MTTIVEEALNKRLDSLAIDLLVRPPYRISPAMFHNRFFLSVHRKFDRWALARFDFLDFHVMKTVQRKRLRRILEVAKQNTTYWGNVISSLQGKNPEEVLKSLPVFTRDMIQKNATLDAFTSFSFPADMKEVRQTSGTTTSFLSIWADRFSFIRQCALAEYLLGIARGNRVLKINCYPPCYRSIKHSFKLESALVSNSPQEQKRVLLGTLSQYRPDCIVGPASFILEFSLLMKAHDISYKLAEVHAIAEHLTENDRMFIGSVFHCKVITNYGAKEGGGIVGYECAYQNGWHINMALHLVEILDEDGDEVENGTEGNIVMTVFDNEAMPFIRYKIGDRGFILSEPCPCGRRGPRLFFTGRTIQFIQLRNGELFPLLELINFIRNFIPPVTQFQFEQSVVGELALKLVGPKLIASKSIGRLLNAIQKQFADTLVMNIAIGEEIKGKNIVFINHLKSDKRTYEIGRRAVRW